MSETTEIAQSQPLRGLSAVEHAHVARGQTISQSARQFAQVLLGNQAIRDLTGYACFVAIAITFVVWGAARLEVGHQEARAAMAVREPLGPVGQSFGGLDPAIYPGAVALSKLWGVIEDDGLGMEAIRWPEAILAMIFGIVLAIRSENIAGKRASLWVSLCWFASLAVIHRSGEIGIDITGGFGLLLALDRAIARQGRLDSLCGLFASIAFLCAGLPPVIIITAASIALLRSSAGLGLSYLGFVIATVAGWSAWALSEISAEAWAAAIALPVSFRTASNITLVTLALCLPTVVFLPALLGRNARESWAPRRIAYVQGWLTVAAMCLFVGTILPQFARTTLLPVVAGCAVGAGHAWAAVLARRGSESSSFELTWMKIATGALAVFAFLSVPALAYVSLTIPYYRPVSILGIAIASAAAIAYASGLVSRDMRRIALSFVLICISIKLAHTAIYVPEWNYRRGQGPWGRAVGQWVPEGWPIYTLHGWPADFAFATGHNFRQLTHPRFLPDPAKTPDQRPSFILLHPADFEHWPKTAPPIVKVFEFHDHSGQRVSKVLARTGPEKPAWQKLIYGNTVAR
ncbi:hypothetical protein GC170_12250 [bacterium]|nr:hypothetical protein [bacterium]